MLLKQLKNCMRGCVLHVQCLYNAFPFVCAYVSVEKITKSKKYILMLEVSQ